MLDTKGALLSHDQAKMYKGGGGGEGGGCITIEYMHFWERKGAFISPVQQF